MKNWQELKKEMDAETEKTDLHPVEDVVEVFRYRMSKGGAGVPNDNSIFTTWFFGGGDVNYLADWCYFLTNLSRRDDVTMPMLVKMMRFWVIQPAEFGNYCGLCRQWEFAKQINGMLEELDKDSFRSILDSYRAYLCNIYAWVYHEMPWGVGSAFLRKDRAYYERAMSLLK